VCGSGRVTPACYPNGMWLVSSAIYWSSLAVLGYTYAGYPLVVYGLSRLRPRPVRAGAIEPSVSIVLAAQDEREHIAAKLEGLLALDYPADKVEIIVVSDGSVDGTDEIVRGFYDRGVVLERQARPCGKPAALNRGVARARGELVVFCDARQRIDPRALRALVRPFADPDVGAVSGELHMPGERGPGVYWRYEAFIRKHESRVDSLVGATGALYAIRRALFRPLPDDSLVDDMFTPLQIALRGYRVVFEPEARLYDVEVAPADEFARKARTLAGNFQLLRHLPRVLHPVKNRLFLQFASHKLMRLACPFALAGLFASNVVLVATFAPGWPLYVATLGAQLAGYGLALYGARAGERAGKLARVSHTFALLNLAAVEGLRRFVLADLAWTGAKARAALRPRRERADVRDPAATPPHAHRDAPSIPPPGRRWRPPGEDPWTLVP
jgi:poly-beta-1,6-N-acetyl-D-glucosamine synthase